MIFTYNLLAKIDLLNERNAWCLVLLIEWYQFFFSGGAHVCMCLCCHYAPRISIFILTPSLWCSLDHIVLCFLLVPNPSLVKTSPYGVQSYDASVLYCCFSLLLCHWVCFTLFWIWIVRTSCIAWYSSELFTGLGNVKCHFIEVLLSHIFLINNDNYCSTCQMPSILTSTIKFVSL